MNPKFINPLLLESAREYRFFVKVQQAESVQASCFGDKPSACCSVKGKSRTLELKCNKQYLQTSFGNVPTETDMSNSCTVIKLARSHVAVDFLIVVDSGAHSRRQLYFVQVSSVKYHQRNKEKRYIAISNTSAQLSNKSPLDFYSVKLSVQTTNCYFVYATLEMPPQYSDTDANHVYFVTKHMPLQDVLQDEAVGMAFPVDDSTVRREVSGAQNVSPPSSVGPWRLVLPVSCSPRCTREDASV